MDNHLNSTPVSSNSSENNFSLPSIKSLFVDSWHILISKLGNLFILGLISFTLVFITILIFGGVGFFLAFSSGLFKLLTGVAKTNNLEALSQINNTTWFPFSILFSLFFVVLMLIGSFSTIAPLLLIDQKDNKLDIGFLFKKTLSLIIPLFIIGWIVSFFAFGSLFFFLIPAFFVSYFLMYVQFEAIFEGKRGMAAIRSSVQMVSQHFGEIFIRCLIYGVIYLAITMFPNIVMKIDKQIGMAISILAFIAQWLLGLYGLVFSVTLYRQVKSATDIKKKTSIAWLVIVAFLGWLIFSLFAYLGFQAGMAAIKNGGLQKYFNKPAKTQTQTNIYSYVPSNCGLSIPLLDTSDELTKNYRHWIYEERTLAEAAFQNLAPSITSTNPVLGGFLSYKTEDQRFKLEDKSFASYTGINVFCTNNTQNWDLDQFIKMAEKNDKLKISTNSGFINWGDVKVYSVFAEGIDGQGSYVKDLLNLGVTEDKKRLFFVRIWGVANSDPNKEQLNSDIDSILNGLQYKKVTGAVVDVNQKSAGPSCNRYTIREGEFASDKCYVKKDYDELVYYLSRFNSAAFSYNGAISSMEITCNGSEFFKNSCEKNKAQKSQAETDMNNYRGIINGIIGRGK